MHQNKPSNKDPFQSPRANRKRAAQQVNGESQQSRHDHITATQHNKRKGKK